MRTRFAFYLFSAAAMLLLPAGLRQPSAQPARTPLSESQEGTAPAEYFRVLDTDSGTVTEVSVRDYLIGAVGAEMPASYAPEALKAQVIACHTYAERIRRQNEASPDPALCGADFSDDSSVYQAFFTDNELHSFYGDAYAANYSKIAAAVDAVGDLLLCYHDEPIAAAFHAISSGETESAEAVWGTALPYLISVPSEDDRRAPQFEETVTLAPKNVKAALLSHNPQAAFPSDPAQWFSAPETTAAGTVLQIRCGSTEWTGQQIREALALRSACFTVDYDGTQFCFTTKGFGHDVGMSQFGANAMAQQGADYQEILLHYYPDTVLEPV